jgi:hypothetical protein
MAEQNRTEGPLNEIFLPPRSTFPSCFDLLALGANVNLKLASIDWTSNSHSSISYPFSTNLLDFHKNPPKVPKDKIKNKTKNTDNRKGKVDYT